MSDVFISWGGAADKPTVGELATRLSDVGLSVFEYTRNMDPGDPIDARVLQEIESAKAAIVCISDTSIPREWVQNEIAWLHAAKQRANGLLRAIIPVQTGVLDAQQIPRLLSNTVVYHFEPNAPSSRETALEDLIRAIFKSLGKQVPIPFPALILAMSAPQFNALGQVMPQPEADICAPFTAAVNAFPRAFAPRYGTDALDFRPFEPGKPLVQVVSLAIRELNKARIYRNSPALALQWMNADLWSRDQGRQQRAGAMLRSNARLLIIDSLSMYHPDVRQMLNDLPDLEPDRTALVWMPAYSHWTGQFQDRLLNATVQPPRVRYLFEDWIRSEWGERNAPWRAFDLGTTASLWHWLYWMSNALAEPRPQQPMLERMLAQFPPPAITPHQATG